MEILWAQKKIIGECLDEPPSVANCPKAKIAIHPRALVYPGTNASSEKVERKTAALVCTYEWTVSRPIAQCTVWTAFSDLALRKKHFNSTQNRTTEIL